MSFEKPVVLSQININQVSILKAFNAKKHKLIKREAFFKHQAVNTNADSQTIYFEMKLNTVAIKIGCFKFTKCK